MYIKRIAESTATFTQGKLYKLFSDNSRSRLKNNLIINDKGNTSKVAAAMPNDTHCLHVNVGPVSDAVHLPPVFH